MMLVSPSRIAMSDKSDMFTEPGRILKFNFHRFYINLVNIIDLKTIGSSAESGITLYDYTTSASGE